MVIKKKYENNKVTISYEVTDEEFLALKDVYEKRRPGNEVGGDYIFGSRLDATKMNHLKDSTKNVMNKVIYPIAKKVSPDWEQYECSIRHILNIDYNKRLIYMEEIAKNLVYQSYVPYWSVMYHEEDEGPNVLATVFSIEEAKEYENYEDVPIWIEGPFRMPPEEYEKRKNKK